MNKYFLSIISILLLFQSFKVFDEIFYHEEEGKGSKIFAEVDDTDPDLAEDVNEKVEVAEKMERSRISTRFLFFLHDALKIPRQHQQVNENLLRTVEVLLISSGNTIPGA